MSKFAKSALPTFFSFAKITANICLFLKIYKNILLYKLLEHFNITF